VIPCCHCRTFHGNGPLVKKLKKFASHHNDGLAEGYRCQLLWVIQSVSNKKKNSKGPILDTDLDVRLSEENPITSSKKGQKPAPSNASGSEVWFGLVLLYHQLNVSINQVATGVMQAYKEVATEVMQAEIETLKT
jgi:hypothetical protein